MKKSISPIWGVILLALLFSPTFLIIKIGVETLPPVTFTFLRCLTAFICTLSIVLIRKQRLIHYLKKSKELVISSSLGLTIPFTLCAFGETYIDSSTTGIIEGSIPLFTLIFGFLFFRDVKRVKTLQSIGMMIGFLGLTLIFLPTIGKTEFFGGASIFFMAMSFALGFLYAEKHLNTIPHLPSACLHLAVAAASLLIISLLFEDWTLIDLNLKAFTLTVLLGVFGTALSWILFFYLLKKIGASRVSIAAMICPIFSTLWGYLFLNEAITPNKLIGVSIILIGVFLVEEKWKLFKVPVGS